MRRQFTAAQKTAIALAALKGDQTINQIASAYEVNPTQVKQMARCRQGRHPRSLH